MINKIKDTKINNKLKMTYFIKNYKKRYNQ